MDTNGHTILFEDYVSFEIAKLLKEKGFEQIGCEKRYNLQGDLVSGFAYGPVAPTQSLALKWLREVYKIIVEINMEDYITEVDGKLTITYSYTIWHFNRHLNDVGETDIRYTDEAIWDKESHNSYEEAVEAALLYVLKNLI